MKILFICDYFPPFIKGGGEISTYWQAKKLIEEKIKVLVLAPKYKDIIKFKKDKIKIFWYQLPFKLKSASPIIFLNPIYTSFLFFKIVKVCQKENIDLLHCQGKYSAPAAVLAKLFLKLPLVLTLRDYRGICNHGFCLYKDSKACNLFSFFKKDFLVYFKNYIKNKNILTFFLQAFASFLGRINTFFLAFFMKKADRFICVSNFVATIYINNGFAEDKMVTVYNTTPKININEVKIPKAVKQKIGQYKYVFLYAGKLSLGKGAGVLIAAAKKIIKTRSDILFIFAGKLHYPIKKFKSSQLVFLGKLKHQLLIKIMSLVDVVCLPSLWPEPLSRVTLEAFSMGKPILSSNVGGQKELVSKKRGWLFKPNEIELIKSINESLKERHKWKSMASNAKKYAASLENRQIKKLISLYSFCINKLY